MQSSKAIKLVKAQLGFRPGEFAPKIERPALTRVVKDHDQAIDERNKFEADLESAKGKIDQLTKERDELKTKLEEKTTQLAGLNLKLGEAEDQIAKMSEDQEHVVKTLKETIDGQAAVIKGLQDDVQRWSEPRSQE